MVMVSSGDDGDDDGDDGGGDDDGQPNFCNPYVASYINSDQCLLHRLYKCLHHSSFSVNVVTTVIMIMIVILKS